MPMERTTCGVSEAEPPALEALILRGRGGDREALKLLIQRYQTRIARFVLAETRDTNAYEDLCQAVFVKMVISLPRLHDPARFEAWLFQIARNASRDHLRAQRGWRRYFVAWRTEHEAVAESEKPVPTEKEAALKQGLEQLSPQDRALLQLHIVSKVKYEHLAHASNTTVSAIKSRLYRARRELRVFLLTGDPE